MIMEMKGKLVPPKYHNEKVRACETIYKTMHSTVGK